MAATKTRPVASGEPVEMSTTETSAIWLSRSPNSEISWPVHRAEKEPFRASRTYGCWRTRSTASGARRGTGIAGAGASWRERARCRRGHPLAGTAQHERTIEGGAVGHGRRQARLQGACPVEDLGAADRRGQPGEALANGRELLFGQFLRLTDDAREQEEGEAGRQERVPDRGHVLDERQRDRDDVGERAQVEQERGIQTGRQEGVDRGRDLVGQEAGGAQARLPDGHVAAVHHDDRGIEQDADERQAQARVRAVDPERHEQQPERGRQQRHAQDFGLRRPGR